MILSATYSPGDNKLRLYASQRLDKDLYDRVKAMGFKWAPKQELFVAPMWTPSREDFLMELCGEIGDEDTSLVDRAAERSERFEEYSEKREKDADRAYSAVSSITEGIPMGQPILVGHHSEKRARKDAERIENGMRRAVQMWKTSEYWERRAQGALHHAKYKELPAVRARRIKTIEADKRKQERTKAEAEKCLAQWTQKGLTEEKALRLAGYTECGHLHLPRKEGDRPDFTGRCTAYNALTNAYPSLYAPRTLDEIIDHACVAYPNTIAWCERWIQHYEFRLMYEKAMLEEQGASELIAPKARPKEKTEQELKFEAVQEALKNGGVQVVSAQLFPTPVWLAERMVEESGIEDHHRVLEPSAGTGRLLDAIGAAPFKVAVEINYDLYKSLACGEYSGIHTYHRDFLECTVEELGQFDRILMNPPFKDGADIKHILHAKRMLAPGGRLVAICAGGPRQKEKLEPIADLWEPLPDGTFEESGTGVSTVLLIIEGAEKEVTESEPMVHLFADELDWSYA